MSWLDKIQNSLIIITGDGKEYKPNWLNATKAVDYNVAEFEFPQLPGTLVQKREPKGRRFNLELYFQGEEHLELSEAFEVSSSDKRPWQMEHPFYGTIFCQPLGLTFDNTAYNVSKITGVVVETILEDAPKTSQDPVDKIENDAADLYETMAESFANDVTPDTNDIQSLQDNTNVIYNEGASSIKNTVEAENYFNLYTAANSAILNATSEPLAAINAVQAMINAPALFSEAVDTRINLLIAQFNRLRESIVNIITPSGKKIYENNGGAIISAMALSAATPQEDDYENRNDSIRVIENLLLVYNQYIVDLDGLQSDNGGQPDSYIPNGDAMLGLSSLIKYTISNLFNISLGAKQERTYILEDDNNIINLAHRFYGLQPDDSTINQIIKNNNIGLNELLQLKKGRTITYYI